MAHSNKEVRDTCIELMKEIYKLCNDDAKVFTHNLKALRPIQAKEVKDMLADIDKNKNSILINLFNAT